MLKLHCVRVPYGLVPATDEDRDKSLLMKPGEVYEVSVKIKRNYKFHCKYFALVNMAWEYLPESIRDHYVNIRNFRHDLEMCCGCCEKIWSITRQEFIERHRSISFDSMDEEEFSEFYERVKDVLFKIFLPDINEEEIISKLITF